MIIRDFVYNMPIIISIMGLLSIFFALKNNNKKNNKLIIIFNTINMIYLFVISTLIHNLLPIIINLGIIIIWLISIVGGILYIISTIICIVKRKKLNEIFENRMILKMFIIIILIPAVVFISFLCKEIYLINNSEIILSYHSRGNGGFGDSNDFAYAVSDKYCKEISIDVDLSYRYYNKMFLPDKLIEINENELHNKGIEVVIERENNKEYLYIYKNKKLVHKRKLNQSYSNVDLEGVFYNE